MFNHTSQTHANEESSNQDTAEIPTIRGQSSRPASQEGTSVEDAIVVAASRSLRKRSRKSREEDDVEMEEVLTPAKKQKVLPLREKDEDGLKTKTRVVVEIPVRKMALEVQDMKDDTDEESSEKRDVVEGDDSSGSEKISHGEGLAEVEEVQGGESLDDEGLEILDSDSEAPEKASRSIHTIREKQKSASKTPKKSKPTATSSKPKHKRFGSEDPEPEPEFFSTAVEIMDSDEEISDDDAPEVVGAHDALKSAQSKARDAAKAVEGQEAAIRKKRQRLDAKFKRQAEAATKKRERAVKKAEQRAKKDLREANGDHEDGESVPLDIPDDEDAASAEKVTGVNPSNLPDLLPDEYLQDDEETESLPDSESDNLGKKFKKKRFSNLVEKKPKDRKKGSTTYRISEVRSNLLAPKSSLHAKNTKESWLKGRGPISAGGVRKVSSGGFFKRR